MTDVGCQKPLEPIRKPGIMHPVFVCLEDVWEPNDQLPMMHGAFQMSCGSGSPRTFQQSGPSPRADDHACPIAKPWMRSCLWPAPVANGTCSRAAWVPLAPCMTGSKNG